MQTLCHLTLCLVSFLCLPLNQAGGRDMDAGVKQTWVWIPPLPLTHQVTLGKELHPSGLQFPLVSSGDNLTSLAGILGELSELSLEDTQPGPYGHSVFFLSLTVGRAWRDSPRPEDRSLVFQWFLLGAKMRPFSVDRAREYMSEHMHTHIYIYVYISIWKSMSSRLYCQFQSDTIEVILVFSLSIFVISFSINEKPDSHFT